MNRLCPFVAVALLVAGTALAQAPKVTNAAFEERAVAGPLDAFVGSLLQRQTRPAWVAYTVRAVPGHCLGCFADGTWYAGGSPCGVLYLEGRPSGVAQPERGSVKLEGEGNFLVLLRIENQQVNRLSVMSPDCAMDAGGLPFIWLTGVSAADSVRMLAGHARDSRASDRIARTATMAIALHADPSADAALEQLVSSDQRLEVRKQAVLWLGTSRGERGYEIVRGTALRDSNVELRKQAALALSRSSAPAAADTLIQVARNDSDAGVRAQALQWLAQAAGKKAVGAITDALANDPDGQVKERAVYALSQLPKDEGVPLLIQVARTNRDARVRQRAMFWLGQSKDPRAVSFFEEVLKQGGK